ncbi:MAG: saccharopine dehydrogenase NADP-binding domain-containing protein [Elusimicrobia bacterium]|nr:saccharopine dehydrogenase NADP-binding domain-containing protein [Elusimicrobiota bacterium]
MNRSRYVVIGGAGAMGRITVKDLVETCPAGDEIVVADYDFAKARALAASHRSRKVVAVRVNVRDRAAAVRALRGASVLLNSAQYQLNLDVMEVALALRCHYVDLGGLFHMTRRQLKLHGRFKKIGRTAVVGMGAAPGITNIMARVGADKLDSVAEIHCRVGSMDETRYEGVPALAVSYSLKTILEEFSMRPAFFTRGRMTFVDPMSGAAPHRFPAPVGVRRPMHTIHSEVATLPYSFKGVREVSFKIAFDPEFVDRVRFLRDLGLASHEGVEVPSLDGRGTVKVAPVDVANKVAMAQKPARQAGPLRQYEVVRTVVKGRKDGKKATCVVDCRTAGMPSWGIGLDIDTGSPPAVAAQMLASGEIVEPGALPPELAVPTEPFFKRLERRGMTVRTSMRPGWGFAV